MSVAAFSADTIPRCAACRESPSLNRCLLNLKTGTQRGGLLKQTGDNSGMTSWKRLVMFSEGRMYQYRSRSVSRPMCKRERLLSRAASKGRASTNTRRISLGGLMPLVYPIRFSTASNVGSNALALALRPCNSFGHKSISMRPVAPFRPTVVGTDNATFRMP